jgi:hypothetical protein
VCWLTAASPCCSPWRAWTGSRTSLAWWSGEFSHQPQQPRPTTTASHTVHVQLSLQPVCSQGVMMGMLWPSKYSQHVALFTSYSAGAEERDVRVGTSATFAVAAAGTPRVTGCVSW